MSSGSQNSAELLVHNTGAHRQTACDALCKGGDVSLFAEPVPCQQLAGPADAGLHLVGDYKNILLTAELENGVHELLVKGIHSALALDIFQHNSANAVVQFGFQVVDVVGCDVHESLKEGEEIVMENVLSGS